MTNIRKLSDAQTVARALNQHPTITATALALGVSRQRLTKYMQSRIRKECTYVAVDQRAIIVLHVIPSASADEREGGR